MHDGASDDVAAAACVYARGGEAGEGADEEERPEPRDTLAGAQADAPPPCSPGGAPAPVPANRPCAAPAAACDPPSGCAGAPPGIQVPALPAARPGASLAGCTSAPSSTRAASSPSRASPPRAGTEIAATGGGSSAASPTRPACGRGCIHSFHPHPAWPRVSVCSLTPPACRAGMGRPFPDDLRWHRLKPKRAAHRLSAPVGSRRGGAGRGSREWQLPRSAPRIRTIMSAPAGSAPRRCRPRPGRSGTRRTPSFAGLGSLAHQCHPGDSHVPFSVP
eukprot:scaffold11877_cov101-Isochrysis_galbana.AAC.1